VMNRKKPRPEPGACMGFNCAVAEAATVGTSAIPLGETAPGCGAEDFLRALRHVASTAPCGEKD